MPNERDSASAFIRRTHDEIRSEMNAEFQEKEQNYASRLAAAKEDARKAADEAAGQRICSARDREEMGQRVAEYRRGSLLQLGAVVVSAASGVALGYAFQKNVDVRLKGVPVGAVLGVPGVVFGTRLDESMAARASLAVGGAMFTVGTVLYALCDSKKEQVV
jgi:hypothetical protein